MKPVAYTVCGRLDSDECERGEGYRPGDGAYEIVGRAPCGIAPECSLGQVGHGEVGSAYSLLALA